MSKFSLKTLGLTLDEAIAGASALPGDKADMALKKLKERVALEGNGQATEGISLLLNALEKRAVPALLRKQ